MKSGEEFWPTEPGKQVTFQRVHSYLPDLPFCTYLMVHTEDLHRFCHAYRDNRYLFRNLPYTEEICDEVDDLSKKLKGYVFVKRVVNFDVLIKMTDEFSSRFGQLCIGLMDKVNKDPSQLESSVQCQLEAVNTHCKEVKSLKQLAGINRRT